MKLNGDEVKQLQRALISAFPSESALEQMVRFTFSENLKAVAGGENYSDTIFNLIIKIESQGRLEELVRGALQENPTNPELKAFSEKWGCQPLKHCPHNIPSSNTDKFVGRENELKSISQKLENNHEVVIAHIEGMGGVGKTELAIQYSQSQLENYSGGICWVDAGEQDISVQIVEFVREYLQLRLPEGFELPELVRWCWRNWREGKTLIVLDDVRDYQQIKPYLPPRASQFKVIITTRLKLDLESSIYLEVLDETEAIELLTGLVGSEKISQELEKGKELCHRLGYLPLALQLVGRYIKKRQISYKEMLIRLEEKGILHRALDVEESDKTRTDSIKRGVKAAFELSWEELTQEAQELGCLLSLFALSPIPWILVEGVLPERDSEDIEDARIELENLHLLQRKDDDYQLHQLIQEFFRLKQSGLNVADEQKYKFCKMIVLEAKKISYELTQSEIIASTPVIPHLAEATTLYQNWLSDDDLIRPFIGLGRYYAGQGTYIQALPWYEQCLKVAKERFGEDHPSVASSYNSLAGLYSDQGRYNEAEPLYQQALALLQKLLGEDHPDVASSINNLALLYKSQGRYEKAEPLLLQALALRQKLLGEDHPSVASSYNSLAGLYSDQGRYNEAEPLYQQALALLQKLLGEDHPRVASSYNNLAALYSDQGRYEKAEPLLLQALALRQKLLGEDHPHVASSYHNLAGLYYSQGRYEKAEPLYQQALALWQKLLGEDHPDVASSINNLALLYKSQGRYEKAEPLYQQALALRQKLLGEDHPDVASSYNNLATLYYTQGRYEKAEPLFQQALALRQKLLGEDHPDVAQSYNNLAELYRSQGRYTEGEPLYQQALALSQKLLGEDHPSVATSYNNLALFYSSQGRYTEAEPLLQQALELRQKLLGEDHPSVATSYNNLALLYYYQGRYSEAEPLFQQALELRRRLLGEEHYLFGQTLYSLASIYSFQGYNKETESMYVKALTIYEKQLGVAHPETMEIRQSYANFLANKFSPNP